MPRRYRVVVTDTARQDLEELAAYIGRRDSRSAALKQIARLRQRVRALRTSPTRGRFVPELAERGLRSWREVVVGPWRIVFQIQGATVNILAVLDGRRDLHELLLARLTRAE